MTARIEPSLLGRMSERRVLRVLQTRGPLSRAEVARHADLSAPAVSRAVAASSCAGLLEETEVAHATGGRPALRLRLASQAPRSLAWSSTPTAAGSSPPGSTAACSTNRPTSPRPTPIRTSSTPSPATPLP